MTDTSTVTPEVWVAAFAARNGYLGARVLDDGQYAAVMPLAFTGAIIVGEVWNGEWYNDRWCYDSVVEAGLALEVWDGIGEPVGWHRHPHTGRRVARTDMEIDERGQLVPKGEMYVRR